MSMMSQSGYNVSQDVTAGIAPGTLTTGGNQGMLAPPSLKGSRQGLLKPIQAKKQKSTMVASGMSVGDTSRSKEKSTGQAQVSIGMHPGSRLAVRNKQKSGGAHYISEFKEERTQSGFIVRQMKSKLVGAPTGYISGMHIESVDEASRPSSRRSSKYRGGRRQPSDSSAQSGGSSARSGRQASHGRSQQIPQTQQVPARFVKFGDLVANNDNLNDFNSAINPGRRTATSKPGVIPGNYSSEIQLLQQQIPQYGNAQSVFKQGGYGGRPRTQYNSRAALKYGAARGDLVMYRRNLLQNRVSSVPSHQNQSKFSHPSHKHRKSPPARITNFTSKIKQQDQQAKAEMNKIVDQYLRACKDFSNIDDYLEECRETFAWQSEVNHEKDKAEFMKLCKDHQIPVSSQAFLHGPAQYTQKKAPLSELYVAGHWRNIGNEDDHHQNSVSGNDGTAGAKDIIGQRAEQKKQDALEKKRLQQIQQEEKEARRLQTKQAQKKALEQIEYFSKKHWGGMQYQIAHEQRQIKLEKEFIHANRKRPIALKQEDDSESTEEEIEDNDDYYTKIQQEEEEFLKKSSPMKQRDWLKRMQPSRKDDNQEKINQLFRVHQMEALKELKLNYDKLTMLLDSDEGATSSKYERIQERIETQQLYLRYFALIQRVEDLGALAEAEENKAQGKTKQSQSENNERNENGELKILLNQTSEMNAIISAGQFDMHRKDVNDRMSSLAFKMEKVYNLDKKGGPAGEVYRYFMHTFKDLKESA